MTATVRTAPRGHAIRTQTTADLISAVLAHHTCNGQPFTVTQIGEWAGQPEPTNAVQRLTRSGIVQRVTVGQRGRPATFRLADRDAAETALVDWEATQA